MSLSFCRLGLSMCVLSLGVLSLRLCLRLRCLLSFQGLCLRLGMCLLESLLGQRRLVQGSMLLLLVLLLLLLLHCLQAV